MLRCFVKFFIVGQVCFIAVERRAAVQYIDIHRISLPKCIRNYTQCLVDVPHVKNNYYSNHNYTFTVLYIVLLFTKVQLLVSPIKYCMFYITIDWEAADGHPNGTGVWPRFLPPYKKKLFLVPVALFLLMWESWVSRLLRVRHGQDLYVKCCDPASDVNWSYTNKTELPWIELLSMKKVPALEVSDAQLDVPKGQWSWRHIRRDN